MTIIFIHTGRAIAKALGEARTGKSERNTSNAVSDWLAVEVRDRHTLTGWLRDAITQARCNVVTLMPRSWPSLLCTTPESG